VRDSCGISGTGETPKGATREEAHRTPHGKRAHGAEINHLQEPQELQKSPKKNQPIPDWFLIFMIKKFLISQVQARTYHLIL
jgi:hypothetical protein